MLKGKTALVTGSTSVWLTLSTMSRGVAFGASRAFHPDAS